MVQGLGVLGFGCRVGRFRVKQKGFRVSGFEASVALKKLLFFEDSIVKISLEGSLREVGPFLGGYG